MQKTRKLKAYSLYQVSSSGRHRTYERISKLAFPLGKARLIFRHAGHHDKARANRNWVLRPIPGVTLSPGQTYAEGF